MPCVSTTTSGTNPQQHGCANSAPDIICPPGTSIPGQFEMFAPETCGITTSAISSQALAAGHSPCASQDTRPCHAGQDRRRVSHSLSPDSSAETTTNDTLRRSGSISSKSAALQSSSANRSRMLSVAPTQKTCTVCQMTKSLTEFRKYSGASTDGHRPLCGECQRNYEKNWRRESREKLRAARAARSEKNKIYSRKHREKYRARVLIAECRRRSAKKGIPFDLDQYEEQIQRRIDNGTCELTGIPFDLTTQERAFSPSLDRIEAGGSYTIDNVRIVIFAVNALLGNWGESVAQNVSVAFSTRSQRGTASQRLQRGLSARLKERLTEDGSMIYSMRWSEKVTPAGRQYCQLVASARRISAKDCSSERYGWTTPQAHDTTGRSQGQKAKHGTKHGCACLVRDAQLSGWPTPTKGNADGSQMAKDASPTGRRPDGTKATVSLNHIASLTGWPTPTTRDHKDGKECPNVPTNSLLGREVWKADQPIRITASGQVLTGSDAGTVSSGQLNPEFSLWLMGFPAVWASCGVQAMPSSRKPRQSSSKNSSARSPKSEKIWETENV